MTIIKQAVKYICPKCKKEIVNPVHTTGEDGENKVTCPSCGTKLQ